VANDKKAMLQGQDWSGAMGDKWQRYLQQFEGMIQPIGQAAFELAGFKKGERVLDIGCGGGQTTLDIGRQVGPGGAALGLDISAVLIATARERASKAAVSNVHFACSDAASVTLESTAYNVLFSRFGVMFFEEPNAAFRNLHSLLARNARMVFCCWGPPPENPWVGKLSEIISRHITLPAPDPTAPGPFAFADQARTRGILEQAGFSQISFTPWRGAQLLGGPGLDPDSAADFAMKAFFVGEVVADQPEAIKKAVLEDLKTLFRQHQSSAGIELNAMAWLVTAQA